MFCEVEKIKKSKKKIKNYNNMSPSCLSESSSQFTEPVKSSVAIPRFYIVRPIDVYHFKPTINGGK